MQRGGALVLTLLTLALLACGCNASSTLVIVTPTAVPPLTATPSPSPSFAVPSQTPTLTQTSTLAQASTPTSAPMSTPTAQPTATVITPKVQPSATRGAVGASQSNRQPGAFGAITVPTLATTPGNLGKPAAADWVASNYASYFQKYALSCEASVVLMACGLFGVQLDTDQVLAFMPYHPTDPNLGMVMENIQGSDELADGSPNWANYGAHAPVVAETINRLYQLAGLSSRFEAVVVRLDDEALKQRLVEDDHCLGAIIWAAANYYGQIPPTNERGQVLGEHVQWVIPQLDAQGRMQVYDVWPHPYQPFRLDHPLNRSLFNYQAVLIESR